MDCDDDSFPFRKLGGIFVENPLKQRKCLKCKRHLYLYRLNNRNNNMILGCENVFCCYPVGYEILQVVTAEAELHDKPTLAAGARFMFSICSSQPPPFPGPAIVRARPEDDSVAIRIAANIAANMDNGINRCRELAMTLNAQEVPRRQTPPAGMAWNIVIEKYFTTLGNVPPQRGMVFSDGSTWLIESDDDDDEEDDEDDSD